MTEPTHPHILSIQAVDQSLEDCRNRAEELVSQFSARRTAAAEAFYLSTRRREWWTLFVYIRVPKLAPHRCYMEWQRSISAKGKKVRRISLKVSNGTVNFRDLAAYARSYEHDLIVDTEKQLRVLRKELSLLVKIRSDLVRLMAQLQAGSLELPADEEHFGEAQTGASSLAAPRALRGGSSRVRSGDAHGHGSDGELPQLRNPD
ncbi:MAG: conjugative transfer protein MobI(A/C) [Rhodanobacter sp.]